MDELKVTVNSLEVGTVVVEVTVKSMVAMNHQSQDSQK